MPLDVLRFRLRYLHRGRGDSEGTLRFSGDGHPNAIYPRVKLLGRAKPAERARSNPPGRIGPLGHRPLR